MKRHFLLFLFAFMATTGMVAQDGSLAYLNQQCPQLTQLYREELKNCHAHYIFAVDVSLSMCRYEETVRPALDAFVKALPMGDRMTIIPFAHDAISNKMGYDATIDAQTKSSMVQMLTTLYPQGADRRDRQYYDTDIFKAQQAVAKSVQMNQQYDVNIIVFISDLLHCPENNIDRQFSKTEMNDMHTLMKAAKTDNAESLVFTLELPQSGSPAGYVYPQLQELYADWDVKVEQQRVPNNSEALIRQWFDQQKDRIMFTKLQSIIIRENKANPIVVKTETNIDGKVKAHIEWKATKLYPKITLDSTYILNSDFYFKANPDYINYSEAGEMYADIQLGQIKHKDFGFHQMADTLHFDVKLPVDYQNEIDKLLEGRPGALANTTEYREGLVFTFFLPLWLTVTLIILLILYIIGVIKAIGRNSKLCFKGTVTVYDAEGNQLDDMKRIPKQNSSAKLIFGAGGSGATRVDDAEWAFEVKKKNSNPFLVFQHPYFVWAKTKGFCAAGKAQSGILSYDSPTSIRLKCGTGASDITHGIKVQLTK